MADRAKRFTRPLTASPSDADAATTCSRNKTGRKALPALTPRPSWLLFQRPGLTGDAEEKEKVVRSQAFP